MPLRIPINSQQIADFCRKWRIRKLAFFGSVLRADFNAASDVDVLYEFEPGHEPGWDIETVETELSELLGRKADLVPMKHLNRRVREQILAQAEIQYAA